MKKHHEEYLACKTSLSSNSKILFATFDGLELEVYYVAHVK